jgi:hypothetical protein
VGVEWALNGGQSWLLTVNYGHTKSLEIIGLSPDFLRSPNGFFMEPNGGMGAEHVALDLMTSDPTDCPG